MENDLRRWMRLMESEIVEATEASRIRVHNSVLPMKGIARNRVYPQQDGRKPNGFWWAFDNDWHNLVSVRKPKGKSVGKSNYRVEIDPGVCNILSLSNWDDILAFTVKYAAPNMRTRTFFWQTGDQLHYNPTQDDGLINHNRCKVGAIAWSKVAVDYDGIELPNLKHNDPTRPAAEWLDIDWHIASGCTWRLAGVRLFSMNF
jgi:hypothetical protein